jgi:hypothetical protein
VWEGKEGSDHPKALTAEPPDLTPRTSHSTHQSRASTSTEREK